MPVRDMETILARPLNAAPTPFLAKFHVKHRPRASASGTFTDAAETKTAPAGAVLK